MNAEFRSHWLTQVTLATADYMRYQVEGIVLLVTGVKDEELQNDVPQVTQLLKIEDDITKPTLFLYHGREKVSKKYEYKFNDFEISSEMLVMWARTKILEVEIPVLEAHIQDLIDNRDALDDDY